MCFSATVSYGSAALLMATGAATTVGNKSKQQVMIAAVPFLFGLQQAAEGVVWETLGSASLLLQFASGLFLAMALVVWPAWIPWAFYFVEKDTKRKKWLGIVGGIGILVSLLATVVLSTVQIEPYVVGHSLNYDLHNFKRMWPANFDFLLYATPTIVPFFISSLRTVKIAGYLLVIFLALTQFINKEASTSVWCFFAAIISFYIAANVLWKQKGELH